MSTPIVLVESGGMAVTVATNGFGTPFSIATNGFGISATLVESGGLPVVIDNLPLALGASLLAWWDPSDRTTLFQDSAGTTPVTAANDPVGLMLDKSGNGVHWTTADAARPLWDGVNALIFNGTAAFMNHEAQPFPSGASPSEMWSIVRQDALAADATNRTILSYGNGVAAGRRNLRRVVSGGVNRLGVAVGNGSAASTGVEATVDFSGVHVVHMAVGATQTDFDIAGVAGTPVSVIPGTGTLRARLGANTATTASEFHHGKIGPTLLTGALASHPTQIARTYYASVSLT